MPEYFDIRKIINKLKDDPYNYAKKISRAI